jgi:hypothetical protein
VITKHTNARHHAVSGVFKTDDDPRCRPRVLPAWTDTFRVFPLEEDRMMVRSVLRCDAGGSRLTVRESPLSLSSLREG